MIVVVVIICTAVLVVFISGVLWFTAYRKRKNRQPSAALAAPVPVQMMVGNANETRSTLVATTVGVELEHNSVPPLHGYDDTDESKI